MIFESPWLLKQAFWARSATLPRNVKILTRRAFSLRVIRGQGGASWHFENDWPFCLFLEVFPRLWEIPEFILDGSIFPQWRIKRSIVWSYSRLISIPVENFPVPGWWPTWLSIFVEIWKIMKIMILKPPWLPKHGFSARSATLPRNVKIFDS